MYILWWRWIDIAFVIDFITASKSKCVREKLFSILEGEADPLELVSFPVIERSEIDTDSLVSSGVPVPTTSRNSELPFLSILWSTGLLYLGKSVKYFGSFLINFCIRLPCYDVMMTSCLAVSDGVPTFVGKVC